MNYRWSNSNRSNFFLKFGMVLGLVCLLGWFGGKKSLAQNDAPGLKTSGSTLSRYYPAPNFRQMEFRIVAEEIAQSPDNNKQFRATNPEFTSFRNNGEVIATITTPQCVFDESDANARTLTSAERLDLRTGDGRLRLSGRGFLWRQNSKTLLISNDVRAIIYWTNDAPPLEITSRWFEFDAERRRGVFHDNVRGENPDLTFTCATLAISGSAGKTFTNSIELIEADGGLEIIGKIAGRYAKANRGTYRQAEQRVELIGNAEWKFDGRTGRADRMIAWTNAENIEATGNVALSLPRAALGSAGGLLADTEPSASGTKTSVVTLEAAEFRKRGDQLLATGSVQLSNGMNRLMCDRLEGKQATRQSPEEFATAIGNVIVERGDGAIRADRADYSKKEQQVLFTGNPRFVQGEINGTAGRLLVHTLSRDVLAENGVAVKFPLPAGRGTLLDFLPGESTQRAPSPRQAKQEVGITANSFLLQNRVALFAGNVAAHQLPADGSEPRLSCRELEIRLAADGRRTESLQARDNVVCERGFTGLTNGPADLVYTRLDCETLTANTDPGSGELENLIADGGAVRFQRAELTAHGERAIYTEADRLLKLLGPAVIENAQAVYTGRDLTYNVITEKIAGNYDSIRSKPAVLPEADKLLNIPPNE